MRNFKGVRNIGYTYDKNTGKGISGQNLGFDKFLSLSLKLSKLKTPLLKEFAIDPFIHCNIAFAPNKNIIESNGGLKGFVRDYARCSVGFGCSL